MAQTTRSDHRLARLRAATLGGERPYLVVVAVSVGLGVVVVSGPVQTWLEQRDRVERLEATLDAVEEENAELGDRAVELRDPEQVELAAREDQGMVRPGEVPYVIVPPEVDEPVIGSQPPPVAQDDRGTLRRLWDALAGLLGD